MKTIYLLSAILLPLTTYAQAVPSSEDSHVTGALVDIFSFEKQVHQTIGSCLTWAPNAKASLELAGVEWKKRNTATLDKATSLESAWLKGKQDSFTGMDTKTATDLTNVFRATMRKSIDERVAQSLAKTQAMAEAPRSAYCEKFAKAAGDGRLDLTAILPEDTKYINERLGAK